MISTLHSQSSNLLYICVQAVAAAAVAAAGAWQVERRACRPCGTKICLQVEVVRCWQSEFWREHQEQHRLKSMGGVE